MADPQEPRQQAGLKLPDRAGLEHFFRAQEKEAEARILEAQNQAQQNDANLQIALASIDAQAKDRQDNRAQYSRILKNRYIFVAVCLVVILLFCGFAIVSGASALVLDIMKIGAGLISGAIGGYFAGKNVSVAHRSQDSDK